MVERKGLLLDQDHVHVLDHTASRDLGLQGKKFIHSFFKEV